MLSKKRQRDYFTERIEAVLHNYELFNKHTRAVNIHKIRVDLKKIRALFFLQEKTGCAPDKKAVKYVRKLFKQAGKIRDAQVSATLMKKMKAGSADFFTEQRKLVAVESKVFKQSVSRHVDDLVKASSRQWKSFRDIPGREIAKLNNGMLKKIKPVYRPRIKQAQLHDSRKLLKRLIYLNSLLGQKDTTRLNTDCLRKLEEAVGNWHDAVIAEKLVTQFSPRTDVTRLLGIKKKRLLQEVQKNADMCFRK